MKVEEIQREIELLFWEYDDYKVIVDNYDDDFFEDPHFDITIKFDDHSWYFQGRVKEGNIELHIYEDVYEHLDNVCMWRQLFFKFLFVEHDK